jgi:hypothetical protein
MTSRNPVDANRVPPVQTGAAGSKDARRGFFALAAAGAVGTFLGTASKPVYAAPGTTWGLANVRDFGATGNGTTNDSAAFQSAVNYAVTNNWGGIYVPPGRYVLASPIQVTGPFTVQGVGGVDYAGLAGSVLLPATAAFIPPTTTLTQLTGFVCKNITFSGGTIPIDMGLRHECQFEDLTFNSPARAAISIVRGERHYFKNVRVFAQTAVCPYGLAFASPTISTIPGIVQYNYGTPGPWVDRLTIDKVSFLFGSSSAYVTNGIYADGTLSNMNAQHILCQGIRGSALYVGALLQYSRISNLIMDQCTSTGSLVYLAQSLSNVLTDVSPGSAGNNVYKYGVNVPMSSNTVFINCNVPGDNLSVFGFQFGTNVGQSAILVQCAGALYINLNNRLLQNRFSQIQCNWTACSSEASEGLSCTDNRNIVLQLMADYNGAKVAAGSVRMIAASGNGNNLVMFDASLSSVAVGGGAWNVMPVQFGNRFEWYDAGGNKRAKHGTAPVSDVDGVIISAQPVL